MSVKICALTRKQLRSIAEELNCAIISCRVRLQMMVKHSVTFLPHTILFPVIFNHNGVLWVKVMIIP